MYDQIVKHHLLPKIDWDVVIDSTKVGMQKPNLDIFEYSTKKAGVDSSEILFIDNSQENIDAAKVMGWQTFFYDSKDYKKSSKDLFVFYQSLG